MGLKPLGERKISSSQVIARLRPKYYPFRDRWYFCELVRIFKLEGARNNAQYQYTIQSENLQDLVKWGPTLSGPNDATSGLYRS